MTLSTTLPSLLVFFLPQSDSEAVLALAPTTLDSEGRRFLEVGRAMVRCAAAMEGGLVAAAAAAAAGGGRAGGGRAEPAGLPCPRCESTDTKFCYYNNYNLAQPRHFCKGCRRYWTRGGALRNVPIGGGTRKGTPAGRRKRGAPAALAPSPSPASALSSPLAAVHPYRRLLDLGGSFTSLLAPVPDGHFSAGFLVGGLAPVVPSCFCSWSVATAAAGLPCVAGGPDLEHGVAPDLSI